MKSERENSLIVFIKNPEFGKVKTRLSQTLGDEFAYKFYESCVNYTLSEVYKLDKKNVDVNLFFSSLAPESKIEKWNNEKFNIYKQNGIDLGERMQNAFKAIFNNGSKKAIIIGTDLPDISEKLICNSFSLFDRYDVVIGPSNDGGYYLLGMKEYYPQIFDEIKWSTNEVLKSTLDKLSKEKIKTKIIDELIDIDTKDDLETWIIENKEKDHPFFNILNSEGLIEIISISKENKS